MLLTIEEFRTRLATDKAGLIGDLQFHTGRYGSEEAEAWEASLPKLSKAFQSEAFQSLHLYFGGSGNMAVEYQLPAASAWCDVVLLGSYQRNAAAVIIELKHWITRTDSPGNYPGLMTRHGAPALHPSDQVKGYVEYCSQFHSAVLDYNANVSGCVLFTADNWADAYGAPPNDKLAAEYPFFTSSKSDLRHSFPGFFYDRITQPWPDFAVAFANGKYKQKRGFVAQIGAQILNPRSQVFELLDNQRRAFSLCQSTVAETFLTKSTAKPEKKVVIVLGPPGSGKSAIAARLWAALVTNPELPEGNVMFTSTSLSQYSNLHRLFKNAADLPGGGDVVRKATGFAPVTTHRVGQLRKKHGSEFLDDAESWRDNLQLLKDLGEEWREGAQDDENLITIVDEAHALINPEKASGRGQYGFAPTLGPQAFHIMRSSLLTVFFLDPLQGFRRRENTSVEDIKSWARELGAGDPVEISLGDVQFRCAGSAEFVHWAEQVLAGVNATENSELAKKWHSADVGQVTAGGKFEFQLFPNPVQWEKLLQRRVDEGNSVRLLSSYSRKWKTQNASNPHAISRSSMDFYEEFSVDGRSNFWSRVWNYVPETRGGDYSWFVAGHPAGKIADDPLCEVGCPYVVRGFDFDYVGLIWLDDLVWRKDKWVIQPQNIHESGVKELTATVRREGRKKIQSENYDDLLESVQQAYRILLTRALKGIYVWVPDTETREYLGSSLSYLLELTTCLLRDKPLSFSKE